MKGTVTMRRFGLLVSSLLGLTLGSGCASFKLKDPPPGFAQVSAYRDNARYKSGDDVGVNITAFNNVKGGTLTFWAEDLIEKLGRRGYALHRQTPVTSKNGVVGTRFDFSYVPPTSDGEKKFYTAILFVSDEHRVVVQLAGEYALESKYQAPAAEIAREIKVRGCRGREICKGPQPPTLSTPGPAVIATGESQQDDAGTKSESEQPEAED
jgi:hypothetical protein